MHCLFLWILRAGYIFGHLICEFAEHVKGFCWDFIGTAGIIYLALSPVSEGSPWHERDPWMEKRPSIPDSLPHLPCAQQRTVPHPQVSVGTIVTAYYAHHSSGSSHVIGYMNSHSCKRDTVNFQDINVVFFKTWKEDFTYWWMIIWVPSATHRKRFSSACIIFVLETYSAVTFRSYQGLLGKILQVRGPVHISDPRKFEDCDHWDPFPHVSEAQADQTSVVGTRAAHGWGYRQPGKFWGHQHLSMPATIATILTISHAKLYVRAADITQQQWCLQGVFAANISTVLAIVFETIWWSSKMFSLVTTHIVSIPWKDSAFIVDMIVWWLSSFRTCWYSLWHA